jgi:hypothetical protein
MNDDADLVDYIKEVRMILADSMDTLFNLEYDAINEKDDEVVPISSVTELIDMSYDVADSQRIKNAETELMKRQPF